MLKLLILVFCTLQLIICQFQNHEVVPDVIDCNPPSILSVLYNVNDEVREGNELTPTTVKNQPTVYWQAHPNDYYLLIMTDPDAPSRANPTHREFLHWIVGNIPGNDISRGETLAEYVGSGPPSGTGFHRYVFLLYKQPGQIHFNGWEKLSSTTGNGRPNFSTRNFLNTYNIHKLVAGNLYQAQWDNYVPTLHQQLGIQAP